MRPLRRCRRGSHLGSGWAPSVLCGAPVSAAAKEGLRALQGGCLGAGATAVRPPCLALRA